MRNSYIHLEFLKGKPVQELDLEIIERKGKGHPDSLIDGACEAVSLALCKYYLNNFGSILHHNVDKGLLVGGRSKVSFGGGEVMEPIYITVAGRATAQISSEDGLQQVPIGGIALTAIRDFIRSTMRFLEPDKHVILDYRIKQGSADLISVFKESDKTPLANDTSVGVGFAPLTPTEKLVLDTEMLLNSDKTKRQLPEIGEDIKVMALRRGAKVQLTVAAAGVAGLIPDKSHYVSVMGDARGKVEDLASRVSGLDVDVKVNAGDLYSKGSFYLTVTGTSAESGDDGNTGRGNRPTGLITPMRQYSMEATAGKNPVTHTGKIFNVIAQNASGRISREVKGVKEVYVRILSRIGSPINIPQVASAAIVLEKGASSSNVSSEVKDIIMEELSNTKSVTEQILSKSVVLF